MNTPRTPQNHQTGDTAWSHFAYLVRTQQSDPAARILDSASACNATPGVYPERAFRRKVVDVERPGRLHIRAEAHTASGLRDVSQDVAPYRYIL